MCRLTLIWDEVPFVPRRSLLLHAISLGVVPCRYVYLIHSFLLTVTDPSTFSFMSRPSQLTGNGICGGRVTCVPRAAQLFPHLFPRWPARDWLPRVEMNHCSSGSRTCQCALGEKQNPEFSCIIIQFNKLCCHGQEEREVWSYQVDTPSVSMAFWIPGLRKVAAAIGKNSVLKLKDGIAGFQLVCELARRGTVVPGAGMNQTLVMAPVKLPISVIQGLQVLLWCCHLCHALLFEHLGLGPQLSFGFCEMASAFIQKWFRKRLCEWKCTELVMGGVSSWWWQLGFILTFALETDLIKRDGALTRSPRMLSACLA